MEAVLTSWSVQDAKARFSELLDTCVAHGPQTVTKRGAETAVLVSVEEWKRLKLAARPTLKELLLADEPRFELEFPDRHAIGWRSMPEFD